THADPGSREHRIGRGLGGEGDTSGVGFRGHDRPSLTTAAVWAANGRSRARSAGVARIVAPSLPPVPPLANSTKRPRNISPDWARVPSGNLATAMAPAPNRMAGNCPVHAGRYANARAGNMVKVMPATSAATFERTPIVTRAASQMTPKNVSKLAGCADVWATTRTPPPIPATIAPRPPTMIFICTTLMPRVRAPDGLQRAAFRASPVVER